eukprot:4871860-Pleurochrysis_carterae.AAC.3
MPRTDASTRPSRAHAHALHAHTRFARPSDFVRNGALTHRCAHACAASPASSIGLHGKRECSPNSLTPCAKTLSEVASPS